MRGRSGTVGVIANPAAGKDIRRLVAHASPTSDAAKIGVVRRAVAGAIDCGIERVLVAPDRHHLSTRAVDGLVTPNGVSVDVLDEAAHGWSGDTIAMAKRMQKEGADVVIVLGGDGTHRDVAKGWLDATIVAISTGTNNVFPRQVDATLAGVAAGLVASGAIAASSVTHQSKVIHASFSDGTADDLALVDLALTEGNFVGSRAVWDPALLRALIACIAEPATVGLSSVAGLLRPVPRHVHGGVHVRFGADSGTGVRAPLAPGLFVEVPIASCEFVSERTPVTISGPGVLAFDGERDRVLDAGVSTTIEIRSDGPIVIDVDAAIALGARHGCFRT
jgi:predicted polyphosphate/ATP-dependent NAD kinase